MRRPMTTMRISLVGIKPFEVHRTGKGSYNDYGDWVEGESEILNITGNEQPYPSDEIVMVPEAFRSKDIRKFFTTTRLNSLEEEEGVNPDKVIIDGVEFSVLKRASYQMGVQKHYECILVREEQSAGGTR